MTDYVTADWHFNHRRIILFERSRFKTIEEHNDYIVARYNAKVKDSDTCYVLGDVGFGDAKALTAIVKKLRGHKLLVMGNHDRFTVQQALDMGFEKVFRGPIYYDENSGIGAPAGRIILSHEPVREAYQNPYVLNVHGHLHNSCLSLPNYYNVNVARTFYSPADLHVFVNKSLSSVKGRRENYGSEWYLPFYEWDEGKGPNANFDDSPSGD